MFKEIEEYGFKVLIIIVVIVELMTIMVVVELIGLKVIQKIEINGLIDLNQFEID